LKKITVIDEYLKATLSLLWRDFNFKRSKLGRRSNDNYLKLFSSPVSERVGVHTGDVYFVPGYLIVFNVVSPDWLMSS
jgi:hypothetical protein